MRHGTRIGLVLLMLCLALTGCTAIPPRPVSFMVFGDPAELAAYQQLVAAFEAAHPDIQIELRHVPGQSAYQKQLVTAFSAGAQPDVMLLNHRRVAQFAVAGGLTPVGDYLARSTVLHAAELYPQALEAFEWDAQTWCIPQNISSLAVYYNKTLFDAAGVPYPADGWTWSEFVAAARALTHDVDGDAKIDQYGVGMDVGLMRLAPFVWQNGGELLDDAVKPTQLALDSPEALEALQWLVDLQVKERVAPDAAAEAAESSEDRFMNGRLAMYLNSRRGVTTYREIAGLAWDVAALPRGPQAVGILHSDGYCLSARASNKDGAWAFIEFANSEVGQRLMAGTGRTVPSLRKVAESSAFLDPTQAPAHSQVFLDAIPGLRRVPNHAQWPAIEESANREIERAFYGQATAEEAAAAAVAQTRSYFEAQNK